jgi:hypothetical protein
VGIEQARTRRPAAAEARNKPDPARQALQLVAPQAACPRAQINSVGLTPADFLSMQRAVGNHTVLRHAVWRTMARRTDGVIARQPVPPPPASQGWSDAPGKGKNATVTMVDKNGNIVDVFDEKGNLIPAKVASEGVWRIPIEGLTHGFQRDDEVLDEKQITDESAKGKAVALIPNMVRQMVWDQSKKAAAEDKVPVDVLLHFHGHGVGYRQLMPGQHDLPGVLTDKQLRDVDLYQMEQQLKSYLTSANKRLLIAVLPQGSQRAGFGDLSSQSDNSLNDVFTKLKDKRFLPQNAVVSRVIVSAHSGGGPTAMEIAKEHAGAEVILFDAINWNRKTCKSNEIDTVKRWVSRRMEADVASLKGKSETEQVATLQLTGTRFRGVTSDSLKDTSECSYGFYYNELDKHIKRTIKAQKLPQSVRDQLNKKYRVVEAKGTKGHERVMGAENLADALKD